LKNEIRKIRRLEFISDKFEGGDSKREVMCIHFGHPMKKNVLVWGFPWEGSHGWSWSSMEGAMGTCQRGERGGRRRGRGGAAGDAAWGRGVTMRGWRRGGLDPAGLLYSLCCYVLNVRKKKKKRKEKKRKRKKKYEKFSELENFWGEK
jgi:hypothetical protein